MTNFLFYFKKNPWFTKNVKGLLKDLNIFIIFLKACEEPNHSTILM